MTNQVQLYTSDIIEKLLEKRKDDFISLVKGGEATFKRELAFAAQAINANDLLKKADKGSILASVFNLALTGLSLNPITKLAYLTPRYNTGQNRYDCILMPSYQGLVKTITDTGSAKNVYAHVVYSSDKFDFELGSEAKIIHRPNINRPKEDGIICAYAVAVLPDGLKQFEVMNKDELDYIKERSDSYKAYVANKTRSAIWVEWESEMCRKTVIKRLVKYLPKSDQHEQLAKVIELDNQDYKADHWQIEKARQLVSTSAYDEDMRGMIEGKLDDDELTSGEVRNIIFDLEQNQLDRINSGLPYNQGDIKEKMKEIN